MDKGPFEENTLHYLEISLGYFERSVVPKEWFSDKKISSNDNFLDAQRNPQR